MKNKSQTQIDDNFIDQKMAEAFGYGDQQLADELDRAVAAAKEQPPSAPEGELQRIINRLERKAVVKHRKSRMKRIVKVLIAAAALGAMMIGGSSWVGAKRYYVQESRDRADLSDVVVFNNDENNLIDDSGAENAYKRIAEDLNIDVLQLSYLPEGMTFRILTQSKKRYVLEFGDGISNLFFDQGWHDKPNSLSYVSDIEMKHEVYNSYLNKELVVFQYELEDGGIQYSVRIKDGDQYYFLEGIDVREFDDIVRGIKPFQN